MIYELITKAIWLNYSQRQLTFSILTMEIELIVKGEGHPNFPLINI